MCPHNFKPGFGRENLLAEEGFVLEEQLGVDLYNKARRVRCVEKDLESSIGLYKKSVELGCTQAMRELAWIVCEFNEYQDEDNTPLKLLEEAAKSGNAEAQYDLYRIYSGLAGSVSVKRNKKKAIKWLDEAVESGHWLAVLKRLIDQESSLIDFKAVFKILLGAGVKGWILLIIPTLFLLLVVTALISIVYVVIGLF